MMYERLRLAEAHVELGERHVAYLRRRLAELEGSHIDLADVARRLLTTMLETQALHVADRDCLRAELDRLEAQSEPLPAKSVA
jgi:hypothetical protein